MKNTYYVAKYRDVANKRLAGKFAGIAPFSTMPFAALSVKDIFFWNDTEEGLTAAKNFLSLCPALEIVKVSLTIEVEEE